MVPNLLGNWASIAAVSVQRALSLQVTVRILLTKLRGLLTTRRSRGNSCACARGFFASALQTLDVERTCAISYQKVPILDKNSIKVNFENLPALTFKTPFLLTKFRTKNRPENQEIPFKCAFSLKRALYSKSRRNITG